MAPTTKYEDGVYRQRGGHTIVVNQFLPRELDLDSMGYTRLGSEEEFAEGRFHPYALPGEEPEGWTPEKGDPADPNSIAAREAAGTLGGAGVPLTLDDLPEELKAELLEAAKKSGPTAAEVKKQIKEAVDAALKAAEAEVDKRIEAAVKTAVDEATK